MVENESDTTLVRIKIDLADKLSDIAHNLGKAWFMANKKNKKFSISKAIEHILTENAELKKENAELRKQVASLKTQTNP